VCLLPRAPLRPCLEVSWNSISSGGFVRENARKEKICWNREEKDGAQVTGELYLSIYLKPDTC